MTLPAKYLDIEVSLARLARNYLDVKVSRGCPVDLGGCGR